MYLVLFTIDDGNSGESAIWSTGVIADSQEKALAGFVAEFDTSLQRPIGISDMPISADLYDPYVAFTKVAQTFVLGTDKLKPSTLKE